MKALFLDVFGASGGVGRCSREIFRQLDMEGIPAVLCGPSHVVDSFKEKLPSLRHVQMINLERPKFSLRSLRVRMAARNPTTSPLLANVLLSECNRLLHASGPLTPALVTFPQMIAPPDIPLRFNVLIHDLNWCFYPGNFADPGLMDKNCRGWVKRAEKVIANSECTRDEIIKNYGCPPEKVIAAPLASFADPVPENFDTAAFFTAQGLKAGQFWFYPGVWGLHKGHETLTEAIELSAGGYPVVVTCGKPLAGIESATEAMAKFRRSLATRWARLVATGRLIVLHNLSEPEMQALRMNCHAYVIPARYEGFGFPMVEAVAQHRPAVVADIPAHREILQRYPQYRLAKIFPAGDGAALAVELKRHHPEPVSAPANWRSGIEKSWSWKQTTQKILSAMGMNAAPA